MAGRYDSLQTGDILLYNQRSYWLSQVVKWLTSSDYSHCSIVLRDPEFTNPPLRGLYILESSIDEKLDAESGVVRSGVRIVPLEPIVDNYDGEIYVRRLTAERDEEFYRKLAEAHREAHGDKYNTNILDMIESGLIENFAGGMDEEIRQCGIFSAPDQRKDAFWCSALVAFVYKSLGYLPEDTNWTLILPKQLSTINDGEPLEFNCNLSTEELL